MLPDMMFLIVGAMCVMFFVHVQVTDPYLNLWRNLVPPLLGTIDLTPLFGFLILQFLEGALSITDDDNDYL